MKKITLNKNTTTVHITANLISTFTDEVLHAGQHIELEGVVFKIKVDGSNRTHPFKRKERPLKDYRSKGKYYYEMRVNRVTKKPT